LFLLFLWNTFFVNKYVEKRMLRKEYHRYSNSIDLKLYIGWMDTKVDFFNYAK
jgi:hypothetical protein